MQWKYDLQDYQGELTDDKCTILRNVILERFGFDPGREHTRDALDALCLRNAFHPIKEYLDALQWDGVQRLETWLTRLLGATDTELNSAIGRIVLIAAVRRIRHPGCKFDNIMVLEGTQGSGKSTAISILAGEYFSDSNILALDEKAQAEALEGVWLYEIAELSGLHRSDVDRLKAFLSRQVDRVRPAYARFREDRPRQCIFIGTTNNKDSYLTDTTGNRRWWPVRTGNINLEALQAERDQLWAEAAYMEAAGSPITLPEELWPSAAAEQEARVEIDPWLDRLSNLERLTLNIERADGELRAASSDILGDVLDIPASQQHQKHTKRLAAVMKNLGWDGPVSIRIKGKVTRGYRRPLESGE